MSVIDVSTFYTPPDNVAVAVVFTVVAFWGEASDNTRKIFTDRNKWKPLKVIQIHLAFLMIFAVFARITQHIEQYMPNWLLGGFSARGMTISMFDLLFLWAVIALALIERRWLFIGTENNDSNVADNS